MKIQWTKALILAAIASTALLTAQEQPMKRPEGQPGGEMFERLKLTDDQRNQIEKLRIDFQKQQIAQRGKLETAQLELRQLMRADNPDKTAIEKKITEVSQLGAQTRIGHFNQMLSIRKILTPEQQKMAREGMKMRMHRGFAERRQGGRGMMRGPQRRGSRFEGRMRRFGPDFRMEERMQRPGPENRREF